MLCCQNAPQKDQFLRQEVFFSLLMTVQRGHHCASKKDVYEWTETLEARSMSISVYMLDCSLVCWGNISISVPGKIQRLGSTKWSKNNLRPKWRLLRWDEDISGAPNEMRCKRRWLRVKVRHIKVLPELNNKTAQYSTGSKYFHRLPYTWYLDV
jgi:hypothetical protein